MPVGQRDGIPRAYSDTRGLSLMPPSTATKVRPPHCVFTEHTRYRVTPARPLMARPGSTTICGRGNRSAAHASSRASSITSASWSRFSSGSPDAYGMACPPPIFSSVRMTPCRARTSAIAAIIRRIASPYRAGSDTCEPRWQCRPTRSRMGWASTRRTASAAWSPARVKPNFWSLTPVVTARCPWMSMSGVTRMSTGWRRRARPARYAISMVESSTMRPTPTRTASRSSSGDFALPCMTMRAGSTPPASAVASSPAEQTSTPRRSSRAHRATAVLSSDLPA